VVLRERLQNSRPQRCNPFLASCAANFLWRPQAENNLPRDFNPMEKKNYMKFEGFHMDFVS
jgi:hypothetical protein